MSFELTVEFTGAVMFARTGTNGDEKAVALLLGAPHHGLPHRPTLVLDPSMVAEVHHLPAHFVATSRHARHLAIDISGLDLRLQDAGSASLKIEDEGQEGIPFARVIEMRRLMVDRHNPAEIRRELVEAATPTPPLRGRVFLQSGQLYAGTPVYPRYRDVDWLFVYQDGEEEEHRHLEDGVLKLTDRTVFHCRLASNEIAFEGDPQSRIVLVPGAQGARAITARIACLPSLDDVAHHGPLYVQRPDSHFGMAYEILVEPPKIQPLPKLPTDTFVDPGANCFLHAQARIGP